MRLLVVIKRFVPFILTFAVGLFIASFFVTIAAPNFQFNRRGFNRHRAYDRQMESENQRLQKENNRLTRENMELKSRKFDINPEFDLDLNAPPLPPAPKAPRNVR